MCSTSKELIEQTWETKEYKGYVTSIHYDACNKSYVGQIMNISDFIYFEANTLEGAMLYAPVVIDDYIRMIKNVTGDLNK